MKNMTKKQKRMLKRILISSALFVPLFVLNILGCLAPLGIFCLPLFLLPYIIVGGDVLLRAGSNIIRGKVFDENFLMTLATLGAIITGEYPEAVAVMLFYQVGELFQSCAVEKSRRSISELMDICPEYANLVTEEGYTQEDPEDIEVGSSIIVLPGERVPLDGIIIKGESTLDASALTGESVPVSVCKGSEALSGCINGSGALTIEVTKPYCDSTVSRILELVEEAADKKAKSEAFITRFSRYYTPVVVILAACLAVIPSVITGKWDVWPLRACTFLVISCPCALVISVPLSFFGGIGAASKKGVLVKGSSYLEKLCEVDAVVFDKTGTLTQGRFTVAEVIAQGISAEELISYASIAEGRSTHPVARAICNYAGNTPNEGFTYTELAGKGVLAEGECRILAGNGRLMQENGIAYPENADLGTTVYIAKDNEYIGRIIVRDELKEDAHQVITMLKKIGIKTHMLTGDRTAVAKSIAQRLGMDGFDAQLLPQQKVEALERIMQSNTVCYVGDGINDAPVLKRSDVGIAMGAMGSDAAIEAADIVIMDDKPSKLLCAFRIAKKTGNIVRQNIWFALIVKLAALVLGAMGVAGLWEAVFADVGVAVIAILNAMRTLRS